MRHHRRSVGPVADRSRGLEPNQRVGVSMASILSVVMLRHLASAAPSGHDSQTDSQSPSTCRDHLGDPHGRERAFRGQHSATRAALTRKRSLASLAPHWASPLSRRAPSGYDPPPVVSSNGRHPGSTSRAPHQLRQPGPNQRIRGSVAPCAWLLPHRWAWNWQGDRDSRRGELGDHQAVQASSQPDGAVAR